MINSIVPLVPNVCKESRAVTICQKRITINCDMWQAYYNNTTIVICCKHITIIPQYIVSRCQDTFLVKMKRILTWDWIFKSRVYTMCPQQDSEASNPLQYSLQLILWWYWPGLTLHLFGRTTWRHWWKGSGLGWPEHPQLVFWFHKIPFDWWVLLIEMQT